MKPWWDLIICGFGCYYYWETWLGWGVFLLYCGYCVDLGCNARVGVYFRNQCLPLDMAFSQGPIHPLPRGLSKHRFSYRTLPQILQAICQHIHLTTASYISVWKVRRNRKKVSVSVDITPHISTDFSDNHTASLFGVVQEQKMELLIITTVRIFISSRTVRNGYNSRSSSSHMKVWVAQHPQHHWTRVHKQPQFACHT